MLILIFSAYRRRDTIIKNAFLGMISNIFVHYTNLCEIILIDLLLIIDASSRYLIPLTRAHLSSFFTCGWALIGCKKVAFCSGRGKADSQMCFFRAKIVKYFSIIFIQMLCSDIFMQINCTRF